MSIENLYSCDVCLGTGRNPARDDGRCRNCDGTGSLTYDPHDYTAIPY